MTDQIIGSGGGGGGGKGGGGAPSEVADNQFSTVLAKVMVAYSSGRVEGLLNGDKSVFLDETQLQADSGSYNFQGVTVEERTGYSVATPVKGFEEARSTVSVSTQVENGTPVVRTVSSADVDAVRIIVTLPQLQNVNESGDIKSTSVQLRFQVRDPAAGVWEDRGTKTISGKSSGAFQKQFRLEAPTTVTAAWDWRVIRDTATSTSARLANETVIQAAVEILDGKQTYPDTAYVAMQFATEDFGNSIPALAFEVSGVRVRVPTNFTDTGGTPNYSGVWDGSFKRMSTENPVWHIYNLLTDDDIGLGLPESFIDRYNFYEAARYCDAVNSSGTFVGVDDGESGIRKRFTINTQITGQKDGLGMLQDIASGMRSIIYFGAGAVVLKQDAPRSVSKIVTNENVKDGLFAYSTTQAKDRITVAKVGYNDPEDFFKLKYVRFPEQADWASDTNIQRYGRNEIEVTKFGCANEAEAMAYAKWIVYTSCNETKTLTFVGGPEFMLSRPGDVIEIADRRMAGAANLDQRMGGRIKSATLNTVELDYPVEINSGESYTITVVGPDGVTLETRNIITSAGTDITTVTVDSDFDNIPVTQHTWLISGTDIESQKFSIINIERKEGLEVEIFAVQYDETKFNTTDIDMQIVPKPFARLAPQVKGILPPTNLSFQTVPRVDAVYGARNSLIVRWTASESDFATRYKVVWRREKSAWTETAATDINEVIINDVTEGDYEVRVTALNPLGQSSPSLVGTTTIQFDSTVDWEGSTLTIQPPTIISPTSFTSKDLTVQWTRAAANNVPGIVFNRYKVEFEADGAVVRTEYTTETSITYYFDDMISDQGFDPSRDITVYVTEQDSFLNESVAASETFSNPAPAAPVFTLTPGSGMVTVTMTPPGDADHVGYYVWRSTTSGFTANAASQIFKGPNPSFNDTGLDDNVIYYYRVAAYDFFDGPGSFVANVSGELSSTTDTKASITEFDFEGLEFTVAGSDVSWTAATVYVRENDVVSTVSISSGTETYSSGTMYLYYDPVAESIESSTDLAAVYTADEKSRVVATFDGTTLREGTNKPIIDGADIIAQTIGASQVVTSGLITDSAQINDSLITTAKIGDLQVERIKIATGAVSDSAVYSVFPFPAFNMNTTSTDTNILNDPTLVTYNFIPNEVYYYLGGTDQLESRIIITPQLFESDLETTIVDFPDINGTFQARFILGFELRKYADFTLTGTPTTLGSRSTVSHDYTWFNKRLRYAQGVEGTLPNLPVFNLTDSDYSAGNVLAMRMYYASYTSNSAQYSIVRNCESFGFRWESYWK